LDSNIWHVKASLVLLQFFVGIAEHEPRADESAVGAINDSVGKIGID